jgi:hypothetical protein
MFSYKKVPGNHVAPDQAETCWRKFHDFYFPNGLFNANGNIRRSSAIFKSSKGIRFASFDTHASFTSQVSTDYPGSPCFQPIAEEGLEAEGFEAIAEEGLEAEV